MLAHNFSGAINPTTFDHQSWPSWVNAAVHVAFNSNSAVILFFIISGYVLGLQLSQLGGPVYQRVGTFYIRRIFRIVPALWVSAVAAFLIRMLTRDLRLDQYDVLLKTMFFGSIELNGPLWTIIVEMWASLAFPILFIAARRGGVVVNMILFAVLLRLTEWGGPEWVRYLVFFHAGLLLDPVGRYLMGKLGRRALYITLACALLLYGFTPVICSIFSWSGHFWQRAAGLSGFILLAAVVFRGSGSALLSAVPVRFIGRISYSLYLIHHPMMELVGYYAPVVSTALGQQALNAAISCALSISAAYIMYAFVEHPWHRLGKSVTEGLRSRSLARAFGR